MLGAGLAGLSAAYELESLGYRVTVIEARRDVGGRVQSRKDVVNGKIMEGGAELIGLNHLAWWSYKHKFGLKLDELPDSGASFDYSGGRRLESKRPQISPSKWTVLSASSVAPLDPSTPMNRGSRQMPRGSIKCL